MLALSFRSFFTLLSRVLDTDLFVATFLRSASAAAFVESHSCVRVCSREGQQHPLIAHASLAQPSLSFSLSLLSLSLLRSCVLSRSIQPTLVSIRRSF
jgi:hypothetical protein